MTENIVNGGADRLGEASVVEGSGVSSFCDYLVMPEPVQLVCCYAHLTGVARVRTLIQGGKSEDTNPGWEE